MNNLVIAYAQMNSIIGGISENLKKMLAYTQQAISEYQADIMVFPELALCGYPPEDLLSREHFWKDCAKALENFAQQQLPILAIIPLPYAQKNAAAVVDHGKIIAWCFKNNLPNYGVFDEMRYFKSGEGACVFTCKNQRIGLVICEDIWSNHLSPQLQQLDLLIAINASPFEVNKHQQRLAVVRERIQETAAPILYVNCVGGQDEIVFDGGSFFCDAQGNMLTYTAPFQETLAVCRPSLAPMLSKEEQMYQALIMGVRDYVRKNGFQRVIIGSSGGIDSALVLAIAVAAFGAENVTSVMMPSRHTSNLSLTLAEQLAKNLHVSHHVISIEEMYQTFVNSMPSATGLTLQNIQARCRGTLLMALSNEWGCLVLNTSNRSEMAVGYSTLYGDMVGSFAVLKDVYKTDVYALAKYLHLPQGIIERAPSAELAANQRDEDNLPPYDLLDAILALYLDQELSRETIIQRGFAADVVNKVVRLIHLSEYKRRQAPLGAKLHAKAFGRDRRYPVTHHYLD